MISCHVLLLLGSLGEWNVAIAWLMTLTWLANLGQPWSGAS